MELPPAILGKQIVTQLAERIKAPILTIGSDHFSRAQLSKLDCFNFLAAARLSHLITIELEVKDTRDLYHNVAPQHLALPGLGAISLATLGAAFEAKKVGTLEKYIALHMEKGQSVVTFSTMKHNALDVQAAKQEKKDRKARKASRQRTAHELRVERHIARTNGGNGKTTP